MKGEAASKSECRGVMTIKITLPVLLDDGWKCFGLLNGNGALASILFVSRSEEQIQVGIDLDKEMLLGSPPVPIPVSEVSWVMNQRRVAFN